MTTPKSVQQALAQALRLERAMEIVREMKRGGDYCAYNITDHGTMDILKRGFDGAKDVWYHINMVAETCTCKDFTDNNMTCKHILAAERFNADLACEEMVAQFERNTADAEIPSGCDYLL